VTSSALTEIASRQIETVAPAPPKVLLSDARYLLRTSEQAATVLEGCGGDVEALETAMSELLSDLCDADMAEAQYRMLCRYLAEEHAALDGSLALLCPQTGQAIIKLVPTDFYQPEVRREDGSITKGEVRLRPELEGALIEHISTQAHEIKIRDERLVSLVHTPLTMALKRDRRVAMLTHSGRLELIRWLESEEPFDFATGPAAFFLSHLGIAGEGGESSLQTNKTLRIEGELVASFSCDVSDTRVVNLRFDWRTHFAASLANQLAMNLASQVGKLAEFRGRQLQPPLLYVGAPDRKDDWRCLPVTDVSYGLMAPLGDLELGKAEFAHIELFGKWEVTMKRSFTLDYDPQSIAEVRR
jgi:hypothetical protein